MKIVYYCSDKPREHMLAKAWAQGAAEHGDTVEIRRTADYGETADGDYLRFQGPTPDTDVVCAFGVKGKSRQIVAEHMAMGRAALLFDKGYTRQKGEGGHTEYSRITVNGFSPARYMLQQKRSSDRFDRLAITLEPRKKKGGHILLCLSSEKYHAFHKLDPCELWASRMIGQIAKLTDRQLVFRPKPSMGMGPLPGAAFSPASQTMNQALRGCFCVVTHGATSAMDAVFAGIPAIALGDCVASPVSGKTLDSVADPFWPTDEERAAWAHAMAYTQWTTNEMRSGEAWADVRAEVIRQQESVNA